MPMGWITMEMGSSTPASMKVLMKVMNPGTMVLIMMAMVWWTKKMRLDRAGSRALAVIIQGLLMMILQIGLVTVLVIISMMMRAI